jgi:hypothetical protein
MTINEFVKAMQKEFGEVSYKATGPNGRVCTKNWPTNPHHPANIVGGVKPILLEDMPKPIERKGRR